MATTPGQPTSYKPDYCELVHNYCLLGATNEVLDDFFGVTRRTIQNWIATHPDFPDTVHRGRAAADATVVRALFDRAKGFSHQASRTTLYQGEARTITNTVSYPPDTQACMFWRRSMPSARACAMPAIDLALAEIAEIALSRRQRHRGSAAAIVPP